MNSESRYKDDLIGDLKEMFDTYNTLAKSFRIARDKINRDVEENVKMRLITARDKDGRTYNVLTCSEVAALVTDDDDEQFPRRDVIIEKKCGQLDCIDDLHPSYLPLQYPLNYFFHMVKMGLERVFRMVKNRWGRVLLIKRIISSQCESG